MFFFLIIRFLFYRFHWQHVYMHAEISVNFISRRHSALAVIKRLPQREGFLHSCSLMSCADLVEKYWILTSIQLTIFFSYGRKVLRDVSTVSCTSLPHESDFHAGTPSLWELRSPIFHRIENFENLRPSSQKMNEFHFASPFKFSSKVERCLQYRGYQGYNLLNDISPIYCGARESLSAKW